MHIRLGLLGAEDSLPVIEAVAKDYKEFSCQSFRWSKISEIVSILQEHDKDVDMWLFAGRIPYLTAQSWGGLTKPCFHLPYKGASLYRTLCEIFYKQSITMQEISFDSILYEDLKLVFAELGIDEEPTYVRPFVVGMTEAEGVDYHYRLWREGKTKLAVTCAFNTKKGLEQLGVPFYRVLPARSAVETVLQSMLRLAEMERMKDAQIAVQMFACDVVTDAEGEWLSADDLYRRELKVTQELLAYAKDVQGSLKHSTAGRYVIFTTRGMLSLATQGFTQKAIVKGLEQAHCGIGIGLSAYEAEFHGAKALVAAKQQGQGAWMVYFDDKRIMGPLGQAEQLSYSYHSAALQTISDKTSLSMATLEKLLAVKRRYPRSEISAQELASQLKIMPRSARRILFALESNGYAEAVGEENPSLKGRPRKLYRLILEPES
ncbi:MAG: hypothetical protein E6713_09695 [Sporomusaceae bacterium]|nr:hypothetical protein [Sporomusaceae bacterium]